MSQDEKGPAGGLLDGPKQGEPAEESAGGGSRRAWWKIGLVTLVAVAAVAVLAARSGKRRTDPASPLEPARPEAPARMVGTEDAVPSGPAGAGTVLATVNGVDITVADLTEALSGLPPSAQGGFGTGRYLVLEGLIKRELLVQKARSLGLAPAATSDRDAVRVLLESEVLPHVVVTEADLRAFYDENREQMPDGVSYEDVRDRLRPILLQKRQEAAVEDYVDALSLVATIKRNEEWIAEQRALAADNPLDKALQGGRPVVVDFGRGTCIPCKMMAPILEDLRRAYQGKAEVVFIEIDEYPAVTQRCGIRAIPTQIFYDASGRENHRHEGFMPREDIVAKLASMGVK